MGLRKLSVSLRNRLDRLRGSPRSKGTLIPAFQQAERLEQRYCLSSFTVIATRLDGPRGLTFGSDGELYVSEAGLGGTTPATGQQVPTPIGPYKGGYTARITKIDLAHNNHRTTVAAYLPSTIDHTGGVQGVASVQFIGGTLYALITGGGPSHGSIAPNGIYKIDSHGHPHLFANLSSFERQHPVQHPDPSDFEPDGSFYSMVNAGGQLYVTSANHQELLRIGPDGKVSRVIDLSRFFDPGLHDWRGPTGLAYANGDFFVGTLGEFPLAPHSQSIYEITPTGFTRRAVSGLTGVLGIAYHNGQLYALETSTASGFPTPGKGEVVRVTAAGGLQVVAAGLTDPTAMAFGPDGKLYVSNYGFGTATGGEIVRINV